MGIFWLKKCLGCEYIKPIVREVKGFAAWGALLLVVIRWFYLEQVEEMGFTSKLCFWNRGLATACVYCLVNSMLISFFESVEFQGQAHLGAARSAKYRAAF